MATETPAAQAAVADDGGAAFRAAFLAENGNASSSEPDEGELADASDGAPLDPIDAAIVSDDDDDSGDADDADGSATDDASNAEVPADLKGLAAAIASGDPEQLIAALGDKAEVLLGAKAHKALRETAKEIKRTREKLVKKRDELVAEFGDAVAARNAAAKGPEGADDAVAAVERFFGTDWASIVKYVNASFAGKPARLEAKAAATAATETAAQVAQKAAQAKVRESIAAELKKSDAKLLEAHPGVAELVFEKMRSGFKTGFDTPAKALAAVKEDLRKQHAALASVFSESRRKAPELPPPPETTGRRGRPMTDEEFRQDFLRQERRAAEAAKAKRGKK